MKPTQNTERQLDLEQQAGPGGLAVAEVVAAQACAAIDGLPMSTTLARAAAARIVAHRLEQYAHRQEGASDDLPADAF